jgi:2-keto-4-pentenoate hydratase
MSLRAGDREAVELVAKRLRNAYAGTPILPVRDELADGGVDAAYAVQECNTQFWVGAGRRIVGRKVGLTSAAVQRQLGVDEPDFGALFADMCLADGEPVACGAIHQARVEAEVAVVLGRDLDAEDATIHELIGAVEFILPAIEVVGSRIAGWDISILDTVADNASSGMFVLGTKPVLPNAIDLRTVGMSLEVDGTVASLGSGAACLGHPYRAALWLVRMMARRGAPLRAGDVVMTGALGPMVDLHPGSSAVATIQGLGDVHTGMSAALS